MNLFEPFLSTYDYRVAADAAATSDVRQRLRLCSNANNDPSFILQEAGLE